MDSGCGGYECVSEANRTADFLALSKEAAARICDRGINGQYPRLKSKRQFAPKPLIKPSLSFAVDQTLDPEAHLADRDDTEQDTIFVGFGQPPDDPCIWPRLEPFRHHIGVIRETSEISFAKLPARASIPAHHRP